MQIHDHVDKGKTVSEPDRTEHNKRQRRKAIRLCKKQAQRRLRRAFNADHDESWRTLRITYCDGDHYGYMADGNTKHQYGEGHCTLRLHFLMFGNVSVYAYRDTEFKYHSAADVPVDKWVWLSDHDSCWRDALDTELREVEWYTIGEAGKHLPEDGTEELAALGVTRRSELINFDCGPGPFGTDSIYQLLAVDVNFRFSADLRTTISAVRGIRLDKPGLGHQGDLLHFLTITNLLPKDGTHRNPDDDE